MAIYPNDFTTQEKLQPGARGEVFQTSLPGYRDNADRVNRTNNNLNTSAHDVPNIKYLFDYRLPTLFKYGFAYGFNQIVIPKGRIVAADPNMDLVDFESQKQFNTLTLANGGVPVRIRAIGDKYNNHSNSATAIVSPASQNQTVLNIGKEWIPVSGFSKTYKETCYRPFKIDGATKGANAQLEDAGYSISTTTGKVTKSNTEVKDVRPGNIPLGMLQRNEYTRDDDAFNGIAPGPVLTDAMVEFPWFVYKDKAEENPWGSAYGALFPGALVKSDENGRITISPLSIETEVADMGIAEYEMERQQVIGQVYSVNHEIVPEGAAKWATWALEDRLNSDEFNPALYAKTNRHGEDAVNSSPFNSEGKYPGYPYDKNYLNHDLHMLASMGRRDNYDPRMNQEFLYDDLGIPGLTDGHNAVVRDVEPAIAGYIHYAGGKDYSPMYFRTLDVNIEPNSLQIAIGDDSFANCTKGAKVKDDIFKVTYCNEEQGIIMLEVAKKTEADNLLRDKDGGVAVKFKYKKRGMSGVPTYLDWDGIAGSVKVLFTK